MEYIPEKHVDIELNYKDETITLKFSGDINSQMRPDGSIFVKLQKEKIGKYSWLIEGNGQKRLTMNVTNENVTFMDGDQEISVIMTDQIEKDLKRMFILVNELYTN
jgi:hypothetical protein